MASTQLLFRIIGLVVPLIASAAQAQTYPSKPVHLIVPFAPGGPADVVARVLGQKVATDWGHPVVVENRTGAGGVLAAGYVAKAQPDGYTLLFVTAGHAGLAALYSKLSFDPVDDFAPVIGVSKLPIVVVVNAKSKYQSLADLVADARARPGKLNFSGGGGGATVTNLAAEMFRADAKLQVANIPYQGTAPAMTALLAGETDYAFDALSGTMSLIQAGKLRPLAITTRERSTLLPGVPTIAEAIIPNFDASAWFGILAPGKTPPELIDRLNRELNATLRALQVVQRLEDLGAEPFGGSPDQFGVFLKSETERWGNVIRSLGLKPQ